MQNRRPPIPVIILLLLAIVAAGYYFLVYRVQTPSSSQIKASGAVEATEVSIAPEISGKILAVNVQEGDSVKTGDSLFSMDQQPRRQKAPARRLPPPRLRSRPPPLSMTRPWQPHSQRTRLAVSQIGLRINPPISNSRPGIMIPPSS